MSATGKLIVLEGIDDAALGVQAEGLYRWLSGRGVAVERTKEPTHGPVGAQIRLYRQGRLQLDPAIVALLWTADRLDHLRREDGICSWLADGRHVLCTHYVLYSCAAQLDQLDLAWLRQVNALCRAPDLTLFLDTPLPQEGAPEMERLRENYMQAIDRFRGEGERIAHIDGHGTADEIWAACQRQVATLLSL
jgi:dTMP kinase